MNSVQFAAAQGRYVHLVPGRLRLEVPALLDNPTMCQDLPRELTKHPGIQQVSCSPLTGRALVEFDPKLCRAESLVQALSSLKTTVVEKAPPSWTRQTMLGLALDFVLGNLLTLLFA
jgi:hypothetical protein